MRAAAGIDGDIQWMKENSTRGGCPVCGETIVGCDCDEASLERAVRLFGDLADRASAFASQRRTYLAGLRGEVQ